MQLLKEIAQFTPLLMKGTVVTVELTAYSIALSVVFAFVFGIMRQSRNPTLNRIAAIYIDFFRGTPELVLLYWIYFALPFLGITLPTMTTGVVGISLNLGAYEAEVVRSSIAAVPREQYLAANALNFTRWQTTLRIILPQAVIRMIPPMGNLFIQLLKATALVSLITLHDLTFQAQILNSQTYKTLIIFGMTLIIYFAIAMVITFGMRLLERALSRGRDYGGVQL